jgi:hypothetical protein
VADALAGALDLSRQSVVTEAVVRAGGGIVWRRGQGGTVEIVLIHRPAYDDWSFPKGKLHPGIVDDVTGPPLPTVLYEMQTGGRPARQLFDSSRRDRDPGAAPVVAGVAHHGGGRYLRCRRRSWRCREVGW